MPFLVGTMSFFFFFSHLFSPSNFGGPLLTNASVSLAGHAQSQAFTCAGSLDFHTAGRHSDSVGGEKWAVNERSFYRSIIIIIIHHSSSSSSSLFILQFQVLKIAFQLVSVDEPLKIQLCPETVCTQTAI